MPCSPRLAFIKVHAMYPRELYMLYQKPRLHPDCVISQVFDCAAITFGQGSSLAQ